MTVDLSRESKSLYIGGSTKTCFVSRFPVFIQLILNLAKIFYRIFQKSVLTFLAAVPATALGGPPATSEFPSLNLIAMSIALFKGKYQILQIQNLLSRSWGPTASPLNRN